MRIAIAETLDPDGAMARWASPDLMALGHDVLPLPTQELAPLFGAHGLAAWIEAVVTAYAPDLLLVCPPYDHAPASTWQACRQHTKVVAFAMDEPLFAAARARPAVHEAYLRAMRSFDRVYVAAPEAAQTLVDQGVDARWLRWALSPPTSTSSLAPSLRAQVARSAVLVGRPYGRRVSLVRELAAALPVMVFGSGWEEHDIGNATRHGPLTGEAMHAVLGAAGVVVTTGDWEDQAIAMVKVRLLEAAFARAVQVAQQSADLDAYFCAAEVPRFTDAATLIAHCRDALAHPDAARARAETAYARALREHTWRQRFAELDLATNDSPARPPPAAWRAGLCAGAADAERRGALRLAATLYRAAGDLMGVARTRLSIDPVAAARAAAEALAQRHDDPSAAVGLYARLPTPSPALGHLGFLDPSPELDAIALSALLAANDIAAASAKIDALRAGDPDRLVATAAVLGRDDVPAHQPLWDALFAAALAANPTQRELYAQHRARFEGLVSRR